VNLELRKGYHHRLVLGDAMPADSSSLPETAQLKATWDTRSVDEATREAEINRLAAADGDDRDSQ